MIIRRTSPTNWRDYQAKLRRDKKKKAFFKKLPTTLLYSGFSALTLFVLSLLGSWMFEHLSQASVPASDAVVPYLKGIKRTINFTGQDNPSPIRPFSELRDEMSGQDLLRTLNLDPENLSENMTLKMGEETLTIQSSIDHTIQDYVQTMVNRSGALLSAAVVLDGHNGRVLAMTSHSRDGSEKGLCLKAGFPAASLFKIIAASAAIDSAGFRPDNQVCYSGGKYTLYRRQLINKTGRYSARTSLKSAFGSSINPVFGTLGMSVLGQTTINDYAEKFLFNRKIPFDFPVEVSTTDIPADDFGLAQIASGYNKISLISPVHAALLASVAINEGVMVAPMLIERISNGTGDTVYQKNPTVLGKILDSAAARDLRELMRETVNTGTCRKSFSSLRRSKSFSNIDLGAKTGTMNDRTGRFLCDWLSAFAVDNNGDRAICIAILSVHGEKLGIKSNVLGKYIIAHYFTSSAT
ncbi:Penicillin-binding protein, transpeptidase domain protein [uncultured Desulfobacterium sp.]|uniref:Penicillin-binding protein, transpeptidase domain protein n=1 Tax=uncultured Desulfobacterium sp. TaxID=201089 RepID=A0A445MZM4_9BACT|nr:Penicillin-binding protein, transpeptidase domain protein [uncultured Desulfobacterium sp.]